MSRKLGKREAKHDERNLKLARYTAKVPTPPNRHGHKGFVKDWPMYGNDTYGDCVFAGAAHEEQLWSALAGRELRCSTDDVLKAYSAVTGFNPNVPSTDQGAVVLDALNWRRREGVAGRRIEAFAQINPQSRLEIQTGIYLFGAVGVGLALPLSAQAQSVWSVRHGANAEPGSWGGHYVPLIAYDHRYVTCVTWGETLKMTWAFLHRYTDEAYALLSKDFLRAYRSPEHFALSELRADLAAL